MSPGQDFAKNLSPSEAMGGKAFEINGQVRLNISKFMVSHDKRQHVQFLFALNLVLKPGQPICSLQFSVKVDSVGGGESHHGLAPAYLCGILGKQQNCNLNSMVDGSM